MNKYVVMVLFVFTVVFAMIIVPDVGKGDGEKTQLVKDIKKLELLDQEKIDWDLWEKEFRSANDHMQVVMVDKFLAWKDRQKNDIIDDNGKYQRGHPGQNMPEFHPRMDALEDRIVWVSDIFKEINDQNKEILDKMKKKIIPENQ